MDRKLILALLIVGVVFAGCQTGWGEKSSSEKGWINLFDGKTLNGWKASENKGTFTVRDGMIVVHGDRSHLFYVGPI